MEISIKWNMCRICLQEERNTETKMKNIFDEMRLVKQIIDCSGIEIDSNDGLPEKICRKCLLILKYAITFRTTCRQSHDYLQSVIQKAKAAAVFNPVENPLDDDLDVGDEVIEELADAGSDDDFVVFIRTEDNSRQSQISNTSDRKLNYENDGKLKRKIEKKIMNSSKNDENIEIKKEKYDVQDIRNESNDNAGNTDDSSYRIEIVPTNELSDIATEEVNSEKWIINSKQSLRKNRMEKSNVQGDVVKEEEEDEEEEAEEEEEEVEENTVNNIEEIVQEDLKNTEEYLHEDDEEYAEQEVLDEESNDLKSTGKSQSADSNDGDREYVDVHHIPDESSQDTEFILGDDDLPESEEILSSEDEVSKRKRPIKRMSRILNNNLEKKIMSSSKKRENRESSVGWFVCETCGNHFTSRTLLNCHIRMHLKHKPFECE